MKHVIGCLLAACALTSANAADIGVSIGVSQPGMYGRIDIGNVPAPNLIYRQPMMVQRMPAMAAPEPLYLYVPPGHARNWRKHCGQYQACGQPVYFVREEWVRNVYVPHHHGGPGYDGGDGYRRDGRGPGHRHGYDRDGDGYEDRGHRRGRHG